MNVFIFLSYWRTLKLKWKQRSFS